MSQTYDLTISPPRGGVSLSDVVAILDEIPDLQRTNDVEWLFRSPSGDAVTFSLYGESDAVELIGVTIPMSALVECAGPTIRLCLALNDSLDGSIYDSQMEEFIDRALEDEFIDFCRGYGEAAGGRGSRALEDFGSAIVQQSIPVLVVIALLAMCGAVAVVFWLEVPEKHTETMLLAVGVPIAIALFALKIGLGLLIRRK